MNALIAIPARFGSTRLPGKPLLDIGGEPMIVRVWRRCLLVDEVERVIVATDDGRIREALEKEGGEVVMTSADHCSGTDRVAEAVAPIDCDVVVNVQGDEPFIEPSALSALIRSFGRDDGCRAATLAAPITDGEELFDPAVVKVVVNRRGQAVYFSRYPVPYAAGLWENGPECWIPRKPPGDGTALSPYCKHVGTYAYRKDFLEEFRGWRRGEAERCESLEQLRILEEGEKIRVVMIDKAARGVDTAADLAWARGETGA
jgi:3-deoxy-manno-octulosonate cytidylyltransferase (CMP-KDO synthetase)